MPNVSDIHQNDEQKNMLENSFVDDELRELTKQLKEISKKTDEEKEKSEKLKEKEVNFKRKRMITLYLEKMIRNLKIKSKF